MMCENLFCVYWSDNECILDEISIDIQGSCESCIYVDIDDESLKKSREKFLNRSITDKDFTK